MMRGEAVPTFLVAEDNENDVILLRHAFEKARLTIPLQIARDGKEVIDCLKVCQASGTFPCCSLISTCPSMMGLRCSNGYESSRDFGDWS
jgi:hypothetical protein